MKKIGHIALREFVATVMTKGFIIGLLVMPVLISVFAIFAPRLFNQASFRAEGQIAIIDPTGVVAGELREAVDPRNIAARREDESRRAIAQAPAAVQGVAGQAGGRVIEAARGQIPNLRIVERPVDTDLEREKDWLRQDAVGADRHLALVVVHPTAVAPAAGSRDFGSYDLYEPPTLDQRVDAAIQQNLQVAIVTARSKAANLDRARIDAVMRVDRVRGTSVTKDGERPSVGPLNQVMPFAFLFLLFFGVMMGGQTLMTSTIEEKSSRVAEVLLSAVSPIELMAGKILGQMGVSLVALGLYAAMGVALLFSFALFGLVDLSLLLYLGLFFILAYLTIGSLMAAIGAAVNEMKEAQSLIGPVMMVLIAPMMLQVPISMNPNSTFSTVISFIPPINTFTMLIRMASTAPPPLWQVWLSIGVGVASVFASVWFAAKVFRVGLLMYGKPPNFATLIRWVRAA